MATLTLKQVPDEVYRELKEQAKANRRSINGEAILRLEQSLDLRPLDPEAWLKEVDELRNRAPNTGLTDSFLREAKNQGRP